MALERGAFAAAAGTSAPILRGSEGAEGGPMLVVVGIAIIAVGVVGGVLLVGAFVSMVRGR